MRRGSADSIRASRRNRLREQAGYKAAICLTRHINIGPCNPGGVYGRRSERSARLLGQLELDEFTASATEDELAAETAPGRTTKVNGFERRRPSRKPFPEHLARERVVGMRHASIRGEL